MGLMDGAAGGAASGAGAGAAFGPWGVGIGAGLGLLAGGFAGNQARKDQQAYNQGQIEASRYTPWTGMKYQTSAPTGGALTGAMQGALSGGMFAANLAKGSHTDTTGPGDGGPAAPAAPPSPTNNSLGSGRMNAELGQMGNGASMYSNLKPGYSLGMNSR